MQTPPLSQSEPPSPAGSGGSGSRQSILFASPLKAGLLVPAGGAATKPALLADVCANSGSVALSEEHRQAPGHLMVSGQCVKKEDNWLEFRVKLALLRPLRRAHLLLEVHYRTDKNAWEAAKLASGSLFQVETEFEFLALRARQTAVQRAEDAPDSYRLRLDLHVVALVYEPSDPLSQRVLGTNQPPDFSRRGNGCGGANTLELEVEDRKLYALPECLSCQSEFFRARIADSRDASIRLLGKRYEDVELFLSLLYPGGRARLTVEAAPAMLALADEFKVPNLKATSEQVMVAGMRAGRMSPVRGFLLARRHSSQPMEDCATPLFARMPLAELHKDAAFADLPDCDRSLLLLKKVQLMETQ